MCGIIGTYQSNLSANLHEKVKNGVAKLGHRGPDDEGIATVTVENGVYIAGHTRLSIIDLSTLGRQPMVSNNGRYYLSYNGEIYNYKELKVELEHLGHHFISDSDTEVLLKAWEEWGSDSLLKLTGMFAFTIFDKKNSTLICVRDPFGIKPFFYSISDSSFSYSSEIPALLEVIDTPTSMNLQKAYDYLVYAEYDRDEETFFNDIYRLMPGEMMTVRFKGEKTDVQKEKWWAPSIEERKDISFKDAAEELREKFLQNIRIHLRSDVPLGAALSGGIDSSAVVCAMRYLEPEIPIHTFSYIAKNSHLNEEKWVDLVNSKTGSNAHKCYVTPEELTRDIHTLIQLQGEPFGTTSMYAQFRVFQLAKENGVTVTLDGQGADELLAGYDGYPELNVESLYQSGKYKDLATFMMNWPDARSRQSKRLFRSLLRSFLTPDMRKKIRRKKHLAAEYGWINKKWFQDHGVVTNGDSILVDLSSQKRLVMEQLRRELTIDKIPRLLRYEDRNSMYWSIESRVPFLTGDLAEFMLSLPQEYLISNRGVTKHIFREAMRDIVPDEILDRKDKIGFETPGGQWLSCLTKDISEILKPLEQLPFINNEQAKKMIEDTLSGKRAFTWDIWRVICFSGWIRSFTPEIPAQSAELNFVQG